MNRSVSNQLVLRVCLTILGLARHLVPRTVRDRWLREWEAEIRHRWTAMHLRDDTRWRRQADLVKQSSGAVADPAYLRRQFTADLLAERAWPGGDAVGERITINVQGRWRTMEVVGVVGRVRRKALENDARPEVYCRSRKSHRDR